MPLFYIKSPHYVHPLSQLLGIKSYEQPMHKVQLLFCHLTKPKYTVVSAAKPLVNFAAKKIQVA